MPPIVTFAPGRKENQKNPVFDGYRFTKDRSRKGCRFHLKQSLPRHSSRVLDYQFSDSLIRKFFEIMGAFPFLPLYRIHFHTFRLKSGFSVGRTSVSTFSYSESEMSASQNFVCCRNSLRVFSSKL